MELIVKLAEKLIGRKLTEDEKFQLRIKYITETGSPEQKAKKIIKSQFAINESTWERVQANVDDIDRIINDIRRGKENSGN